MNLTQGALTIPFSLPTELEHYQVKLKVYDLTGRVWWQQEQTLAGGSNCFIIPEDIMKHKGLHFYEIEVRSEKVKTKKVKKFIKQ